MSVVFLALVAAQALLSSAEAGVPIRLPAQERVADWQEALTIAGLSPGTPGDGAWVDVTVGATVWTLRVRDLAGVLHDATVAPPRTEQEREDVALLAASLLQPVAVPVRVAAAPPPPVKPTPRPPPPPAPAWPPAAEVPVVVAAPEPVVVAPPPAPPAPEAAAPPAFEGRVGLAGEVRPWSVPTALVWGEVQLVGSSPIRPAIGGSLTAPAGIPLITDDVHYWSGEVWVGAWYAADAPVRFDLGVTLGAAARTFLKDDLAMGVAWIPVFSTRVEAPLRVAPWLVVEPGVHLLVDTREVDLQSDEDGTFRFGDWSGRVSVAFRASSRKSTKP
jgi:hypothetical protein